MLTSVRHRLHARSSALLLSIEGGVERMAMLWLGFIVLACAARIATSPLSGLPGPTTWLAYGLLAAAPVASLALARRWFANGDRMARPARSLDQAGWRPLALTEARQHRLYGPSGLMVSLLVGMLLNVPVRAAEYFAALPALSAQVPAWLAVLHFTMTLDVVLFTSLYAIAFMAALKRSPVFPRLIMLVWAADLAMQLGIAQAVAGQPDLPTAVGSALHRLLDGNAAKVLISVAIWLPYLLLSKRVNVTYRHRIPA